jgi:hypothetical protein
MKRTGRRLTLSNDINSLNPSSDTISSGDYRLTTIFSDDRENYAWKIVDIKQLFPTVTTARPENWALMSIRPQSFESLANFLDWSANHQPFDNSLIGTFSIQFGDNYSLRVDHVATNHLSLFYDNSSIPYYNITLEEYEITSREEIMFKIKETSQSLEMIG